MNTAIDRDLTGTLARYFSGLTLEEIPPAIQQAAKRLLLDTLGCMSAATRTAFAPLAYKSAEMFGRGNDAAVVGLPSKANLAAAVYANARLGNGMDLDETFPVGHHFGVGAVAAALALAETNRRSGTDLLLAIIAGYELGGRLASAAGPPMSIAHGRVTGYPELYGFSASVVFAAAMTKSLKNFASCQASNGALPTPLSTTSSRWSVQRRWAGSFRG